MLAPSIPMLYREPDAFGAEPARSSMLRAASKLLRAASMS